MYRRRRIESPDASRLIFASILAFMLVSPAAGQAGRITVSLDGDWQIEDSVSGAEAPSTYRHQAPVPGLANLATPPFPGVDLYESREFLADQVRFHFLPKSALTDKVGIPRQERNYFWYHRTFKAPAKKAIAILRVNKAQFGTAVWLNGKHIGEHTGCFDSGYFNLTSAMDWSGDNRLVIRIGAHPAVLPETVAAGTDQEKRRWTPGIYDSVSLLLSDDPVIENVQVAPRIRSSEIVVQTRIRNYGAARSFELAHRVTAWKGGTEVVRRTARRVNLKADEESVFTDVLRIPGARLWSPEDPFLYVLETATGGDSLSTRFGMREFSFDTATQRAYLNGKVYFLRGSNITLHRFFEDPNCGRLPWDEQWVRKLLIDIPKRMSWNSFRFCIGPVPDRWLDIADEAGLLIQNEFFIWKYHDNWDTADLIRQFKGWMTDNWNHPSVAIWDTCNETTADVIGDKIIPAVRSLDLSGRPWENSYNLPAGPDDPVEIHPYLFAPFGGLNLQLTDLEQMNGFDRPKGTHTTAHARILNEYDWLWVNRDGSPTGLTRPYFEKLLGAGATAEQRFQYSAYAWAGLTEFWRAHRNFAGVLHFVYLTSSFPEAFTSDHFADVRNLRLEPHFEDYMSQAFKPLGIYINFWQPKLAANSKRRFLVMMVNDEGRPAQGKLALTLESEVGTEAARSEAQFAVPALGQQSYNLDLHVPPATGKYLLKATAYPMGGTGAAPTVSRRKVAVEAAVQP